MPTAGTAGVRKQEPGAWPPAFFFLSSFFFRLFVTEAVQQQLDQMMQQTVKQKEDANQALQKEIQAWMVRVAIC